MKTDKYCPRCNSVKPFSEFCNRKDTKDGLRGECRSCTKVYMAKYQKENMESYRMYEKKYRDANSEKVKKGYSKSYMRNKKKILEKRRGSPQTKARSAIFHLLRKSEIVKETCFVCDSTKNIQAHHPDYSRPLHVYWLCRECHALIHRKYK